MRLSNYYLAAILTICVNNTLAYQTAEAGSAQQTESRPLIRLSATAQSDIPNDLATLQLFVEVGDTNASVASSKATQLLQMAINSLGKDDRSLSVKTSINVNPSFNREGKRAEWRARGLITLEGADFVQLSKLASRLGNEFAIQSMTYRLKDTTRVAEQNKLKLKAIDLFRSQASQVAEAFGYKKYELVNIDVNSNSVSNAPQMYRLESRSLSSMAASSSAPSVPLEGGEETITAVVTGTIGLVP